MTDQQYIGMLIDNRQKWNEVLKMALEDRNTRIAEKAREQINLIDEKIKA